MNVTPKCSRWQRTGENRTEINELQVKIMWETAIDVEEE